MPARSFLHLCARRRSARRRSAHRRCARGGVGLRAVHGRRLGMGRSLGMGVRAELVLFQSSALAMIGI